MLEFINGLSVNRFFFKEGQLWLCGEWWAGLFLGQEQR